MINISYNVNTSPVVLESDLVSCPSNEALLYLYKEDGAISLDVEVKDDYDFTSQIYDISKTAKKYKVQSNTEAILVSNISINSTPYFYELVNIGDEEITQEEVALNSTITCVEYKGRLYTNDKVVNVDIGSDKFLHSIPVINLKPKITYHSKYIQLEYDNNNEELYFKCANDLVIDTTLIYNNKVRIPSFYVTKNREVFQCVEGDILHVEKDEQLQFTGNRIEVKDYIESYNKFYNHLSNSIYLPFNVYVESTATVSYTAKRSSHIFKLKPITTYFKILERGLEVSDSTDYDFKITKKVDYKKFKVVVSQYLNENTFDIKTNDYVFTTTRITNDSMKVGLKQEVITNFSKPPTEVIYIKDEELTVYQSQNSLDIDSIEIETDSYSYTPQPVNTISYFSDKTNIKPINKYVYYTSKKDSNDPTTSTLQNINNILLNG